ncbi:signal transduction histidine kinase [Actinoplanes lutulentus]|uniref:histidine kinase n=1 Tax=Actinoplanes lutulentus TaxID=1287878 RepID=A0A327Z6L2_9ACTN|nr:GAF domain-containing sensor histidine kinase [Actinoplanes lutulentus]MBB2949062.1 signal transduction histidine kinase [Actinoplanes lutulentus]RAK31384.1 signal transduction histidine kinase [Actinoplanes lutulentus]
MTALQSVDTPFLAAERYRAALAEVPEVLELAAEACQAPMAALKVIGGGSAHYAATLGIRTRVDIPHSMSLCEIVSSADRPMIVDDATLHPRLSSHPLVAGSEHVRFVGAAPLHHNGQIVGALCVFDDAPRGRDPEATSRLLSRIARRVDAETGLRHTLTHQAFPLAVDNDDIVSAISHEIRTPLANIQGSLELLTATPGAIAPGFARRIDAINRNAARLCRTVDSLLRAVDHQSQEPIGEPRVFDLRTMLTAVHDERLRLDLPDAPVWVTADPCLLEVAIGHLLTNALCFGGPDQPVEVTLTDFPRPTLVIRDHGPGMPESELQLAGVPFARGDLAIRDQMPGLGLGLSISRRILEAQGGVLHLDSVAGEGVTARIMLSGA